MSGSRVDLDAAICPPALRDWPQLEPRDEFAAYRLHDRHEFAARVAAQQFRPTDLLRAVGA